MNKEIKEKWITALRSGEYKQARNFLKQNVVSVDDITLTPKLAHCCLGVLCELYIKEENNPVIGWKQEQNLFYFTPSNSPILEAKELPLEVCIWAGLEENNPTVPNSPLSLAELNDEGKTFEEIATIIEEKF